MTDTVDLEKYGLEKYGNFYAPAFKIWIDHQDIVEQYKIEIVSVSVDSRLDGASSFTFTINNAFDITNREVQWFDITSNTNVQWFDFFKFGKPVAIYMGYANSTNTNSLSLVIFGLITSIKMDFPSEGAPQMEVSGFDLSFKLMKEKKARSYASNTPYREIAELIVQETSTHPGQEYLDYTFEKPEPIIDIDTTIDNEHQQTVKNTRESDFDFLTRLAQKIYYDFFVFNFTVYFRKPVINEAPVVTLEWGKSLVSFSPELDISALSKGIAVKSRNTENNKDFVGVAINNNIGGDVTELLKEVFGTSQKEDQILGIDVLNDPVSSDGEAKNLAKAFLQKKNENYLKGTGESIGIPEILAGKNIKLKGLGGRLSATYYIEKANHSISSSGYKTTFSVKYMLLNTDEKINTYSPPPPPPEPVQKDDPVQKGDETDKSVSTRPNSPG